MKTAIWFSRHEPTPAQLAEIETLGFTLAEVALGQELASVSIETEDQANDLAIRLESLAETVCDRPLTVFGVIPVPLRAQLQYRAGNAGLVVYEAWNVTRTPEGGKPTFTHKRWVKTIA